MEKTQFFHSLLAGLHRAAASRFTFFKGETPRVTKNNQNVENTSRRFRALHAALEHFKPYGLSFRGKSAFFPLTLGRAALCCRLAFHLFQS
ncbi:hypothetical protein [uncultured Desulfovibrio sp.]|uniref:hypothetical protein n=1 Tax=uncultured Desulfovibrio sp. TaxID=167968 RepID=UPI0026044F33|nr:hypothetical protein [uncultured Desulfovibrio sp.]